MNSCLLLTLGIFVCSSVAFAQTASTNAVAKKPVIKKVLPKTTINSEGKEIHAKSYLNKKAPEIVVEKWLTAEPDRAGKFVIVDFWATWCGPCKAAIPELNQLQKKYPDKLVVIGLSNEKPEKVLALKEPKIDYTLAVDTKDRTNDEMNVTAIPHIILIDPTGVVRWEGNPRSSSRPFNDAMFQLMVKRYWKLSPLSK